MKSPITRRSALATSLGLAATTSLAAAPENPEKSPGSGGGRARPLAQSFTDVYHVTEPKLYVEGPGLIKLPNGSLLAIVPVVPRGEFTKELRADHSHTHLVRSDDAGLTWIEISKLPYYSAAPFLHDGTLYLFGFQPGPKLRNDDMVLLRSPDLGVTWSAPVTLFKGHFWNTQSSMVVRNDTLYWSVDDIGKGLGEERVPRVIAGKLSADLMDPKSWRMSNPVPFPGVPKVLMAPKFAKYGNRWLEPNLIEVRGKLRVVISMKINNQTSTNLAGILDVTDEGGELKLDFAQYHPMPGGHLHFSILWDEPSKMFWATMNLAVDAQESYPWWDAARKTGGFRPTSKGGDDRRILMLMYGLDGLNWFQAGCVAMAPKLAQSFMYATPIVDGDDLAIIARSSINAPHQHDADHATFHRVRNFRKLAMNLVPEA